MAKLLPPYIEGKLPAQSDIARLVIPYRLNRAVGVNDFDSIAIKIKDLNTNQDLSAGYIYNDENRQKGEAIFTTTSSELKYGKHYKVQLAFQKWEAKENGVRELVEGYYSAVGVFKLGTPGISVITNLISSIENTFPFFLQGKYEPVSYDQAEKAYSYRFEIVSDGEIKECSEELFTPFYAVKMRPEEGENYSVKMITTTINGFKSVSKTYTLSIDWKKQAATLEHDLESGRNIISFDSATTGGLYLFEALGDDFKARYINDIIALDKNVTLYDSNVEHGSKESYHIYKINQQGQPECEYTVDSDSNPTYFDDIFLSDDDREVCIKYNPQISSFKTNILESKQETLGGKYPYFFRNGHVGYNEFPISGLITRLADPSNSNNTIRTSTDAQNDDSLGWSTNLTHDNFAAERKYKMELLKWLNNGKTKLFRSPAEGNYYVRLMNVSLSPNQTLGRMLHTFNCTAYEVEAPKNQIFQNENKLGVPVIEVPETITVHVPSGYFSYAVDRVQNVRYIGNVEDSVTVYTVDEIIEQEERQEDVRFTSVDVIQISGFSLEGGTLYYTPQQALFEGVQTIEYFNNGIADMTIPLQNNDDVIIYADRKTVVELTPSLEDTEWTWDLEKQAYIYQSLTHLLYNNNNSIGYYIKENDEIDFVEDAIHYTPEQGSLTIGRGIRARVYRNVGVVS